MDKFTHALVVAKSLYFWFCGQAAPYLVGVAIPSAIAALSKVPKSDGFIAFLLKASRFLGVLTFSNEPGTVKAPLGLGKVVDGLKAAAKGNPALALVLVGLTAFSGCAAYAAFRNNHPTVAKVLDCTSNAVLSSLPAIAGDILAALTGSQPDWSALTALEEKHGMDAVGCAVVAVMGQAKELGSEDGGTMAMSHMASRVALNAAEYLKARGY